MNIKQAKSGIESFLREEIMPKATGLEKGILIGAPILGVLDIEGLLHKALYSKIMAGSNIWLDEKKDEFSPDTIKLFAETWLKAEGGRYVYPGYEYDLGITKIKLFEGYVINQELINNLFRHLSKAEAQKEAKPAETSI